MTIKKSGIIRITKDGMKLMEAGKKKEDEETLKAADRLDKLKSKKSKARK